MNEDDGGGTPAPADLDQGRLFFLRARHRPGPPVSEVTVYSEPSTCAWTAQPLCQVRDGGTIRRVPSSAASPEAASTVDCRIIRRRWRSRNGVKLPALMARFPKPFWWRPDPDKPWRGDWPVVPEGIDDRYPDLVPDFQLWRDEFERPFRRLDHDAQVLQQQFWRQHVALIGGGLLATMLGAYQAATGGGNQGVAAAQAVLTGV